MRRLPSALLALVVLHALGDAASLETRQSADNSTAPAPISFTPDGNWEGIDGSWSTFTLRIGTPEQTVQTFISFNSYQTWTIISPQGCQAAADPAACAESRGGLFNQNASSTFQDVGLYDTSIEDNLGYGGSAVFGYDSVGLEGQDKSGPTIQNTTVGALAIEDFYLGVFGLNPQPTYFMSLDAPSPSYMNQLKEQQYIPSVSAAYTAGARYRRSGVLASLTLGGYDSSKFIDNDVQFGFAADIDRSTVVAIRSITTPSDVDSSPVATELLPEPIYAFIDSTVSGIWLPVNACRVFESEFGLTYDDDSELYLVNSTLHESLTDRNASITFTLGQTLSGNGTVQITLPYAAFDLTASPPYGDLTDSSYYFPLRRAANDTQYTLGRTFLQEAYFTVDWERQQFNVSQVNWDQSAEQNIVAIPAYTQAEATYPGVSDDSSSNGELSGGAIAGIVIGVVAGVGILAGLLFWFCWRRRRAARRAAVEEEKLGGAETPEPPAGRQPNVFPKAELEGSSPVARESDRKGLLTTLDESTDGSTPHTPSAPSRLSGYFRPGSSAYSPTTPSAGEGTYSSSHSGSNSNGNRHSLLSPLTPASEADSRERQVFEMPGDMPTIKEKDGKSLSEKEVLAHRERVYNGVESPSGSMGTVDEGVRESRRINPNEVVRADAPPVETVDEQQGVTLHRAFSFEEERPKTTRSSDELYE
ncbi:hypothetical protein B0A50_02465 [Salinomyces thailandicus]|uniref:Peptidase A1 domain-containing protein n=1 Tax=Salinomyces thailandicus TaxID=706561 RepID=A0A4U0U918_9PEZI|nr:hypothetical protein B0A50_02465 [Salinomyces thailandica]